MQRRDVGRGPGALGAVVAFSIAFGFVEAAVVYYLRHLLASPATYRVAPGGVLVNLGAITFVRSIHSFLPVAVERVEMVRESATMVMLVAVAVLAGHRSRQRWGAFLVAFSTWDLSYYLFLRIIDGWPTSLFTRDVFFLLPVPSVGPVVTPVVIFSVALVVGLWLWRTPRATHPPALTDDELADQSLAAP